MFFSAVRLRKMPTGNKYKVSIRRNGQTSIRVFARIHPLNKAVYSKNYSVKECINNDFQVLRLCPPVKAVPPTSRFTDTYDFTFDKVFSASTSQKDVFEIVAVPIVNSVLTGINGTIFAYGQTGTGKTYTMTGGRGEARGLQPRIMEYIFSILKKKTDTFRIGLSYLEIYNEVGFDLLNPRSSDNPNLPNERVSLLEDIKGRLHVRNLTVQTVENVQEALHLLKIGEHNRCVSATPDNPHSSRSHCMLIVHLDSTINSNLGYRVRAKLNIVDLAGSERLFKPNSIPQSGNVAFRGVEEKVKEETKHINLSLHYLEQVIICLSRKCSHVPYRNSMMTTLLRDSLGGNCLTAMIATLSLALRDIEETISTCRFAQRVALVCNVAFPNEIPRKPPSSNSTKSGEGSLTVESKLKCEQTIKQLLTCNNDKINVSLDHNHIVECFRLLKEQAHETEYDSRDKEILALRKTLDQRNQEISTLINLLKKTKKQLKEEVLITTPIIVEEKSFNCNEEENEQQMLQSKLVTVVLGRLNNLLEKVRVENFFESKSNSLCTENDNYQILIAEEVGKLSEVEKSMLKIYLAKPEHTTKYDKLSIELKENYSKAKNISKTIEKEKDVLNNMLNNPEKFVNETNIKNLQHSINENLIFLKGIRAQNEKLQVERLEIKWEIYRSFKKWLRQHHEEVKAIEKNETEMSNKCYNFIVDAKNTLKCYLKKHEKNRIIKQSQDEKVVRFTLQETKSNGSISNISNKISESNQDVATIFWENSKFPEGNNSNHSLSDVNSIKYEGFSENDDTTLPSFPCETFTLPSFPSNNSLAPPSLYDEPINQNHSHHHENFTGNPNYLIPEEIPTKLSSDYNGYEIDSRFIASTTPTLEQIRMEIENQYRAAATLNTSPPTSRPPSPIAKERNCPKNNDEEYKVPLTGDPEIDEEILAFYKAREKLTHKTSSGRHN